MDTKLLAKNLSEQIEEKLKLVMERNENFTLSNVIRNDGHHGYLIELLNGINLYSYYFLSV